MPLQADIPAEELKRRFEQENKRYWDAFSPHFQALKKDVILVDLLVEFPPYIHGLLIIAKYLQKKTNAQIIGIVRDQDGLNRISSLLYSFSIKKVFFAKYAFPPKSKNLDWFIEDISKETDPYKLRKKVLGYSIDNLVVGDLIYDAYLRDTGHPTILQADKTLVNYFSFAHHLYDTYARIFHENKVIATIQGHTHYLLYGMLAHVAVKNGIPVYGRKPGTSPCAIRKYNRLSDLRRFERSFTKEDFDDIYQNKKDYAIQVAKSLLANKFQNVKSKGTIPYVYDGYQPDKKTYSRESLAKAIGLNSDKPNVFLMCHAFIDAPHLDSRMIHNDYYEWLEDTLEIVSNIDAANWIVRPHPDDKYYHKNTDNHTSLFVRKYMDRFSHIFLAPDDMSTPSVAQTADVVITVRGSAGIEFPSVGIPCITTGKQSYSSLGFTIEPETRDEYVDILRKAHTLQRLTDEQVEKALVAYFCYFYLSVVECRFVPSVTHQSWVQFDSSYYWAKAYEALNTGLLTDDPLYRNFQIQMDNNLQNIMKFEEIPKYAAFSLKTQRYANSDENLLDDVQRRLKTVLSEFNNSLVKQPKADEAINITACEH